jgi:excisionase family DNA binding protein
VRELRVGSRAYVSMSAPDRSEVSDTPPSDEPATLSVESAARILGISRALAYQLVRTGEIPCLKLGRRVVVPRRALAALLDVQPEPAPQLQRGPERLELGREDEASASNST